MPVQERSEDRGEVSAGSIAAAFRRIGALPARAVEQGLIQHVVAGDLDAWARFVRDQVTPCTLSSRA